MILYLNTNNNYADIIDFHGKEDVEIAYNIFSNLIKTPAFGTNQKQSEIADFDLIIQKKDKTINDLLDKISELNIKLKVHELNTGLKK